MKKSLFLAAFLIGWSLLSAQNLSGIWKGFLKSNGCFSTNYIELYITANGEVILGEDYHYQDIDNFVQKNFTGQYSPSTRKLFIQEDRITGFKLPNNCVICTKQFNLTYKIENNEEILFGTWSGYILPDKEPCNAGDIVMRRELQSAFKGIPQIKVDTGVVRLDFYDNAIIDGDIISVNVNGSSVVNYQPLTNSPITTFVTVTLDKPFHEVEMIGENMGSIPPNTALLIITAGTERHLLHMESTEEKNARVRILYDPVKFEKKLMKK